MTINGELAFRTRSEMTYSLYRKLQNWYTKLELQLIIYISHKSLIYKKTLLYFTLCHDFYRNQGRKVGNC